MSRPDRTLRPSPSGRGAARRSPALQPTIHPTAPTAARSIDGLRTRPGCLRPAGMLAGMLAGLRTGMLAGLCAGLLATAAPPAQASHARPRHRQPAATVHPAHRPPACRRHSCARRAPAAVAAAPLVAAEPAAQPAWTVYAGVLALQNQTSMGDLTGMNTPSGLRLRGGDATTPALGILRRLGERLSVELALGVPPEVDTVASGSGWTRLGVAGGSVLARADVVSPTLFLNWHLLGTRGRWSPFIGLGLNYTHFANVRPQPALSAPLGPTRLGLSDSWGAAAHAGLHYRLSPRWSLLAAVALTQIDTTLSSTSSAVTVGGQPLVTSHSTAGIRFRPLSYTLALGYSF